jgi:hypothetical protein
MTSSFTRTLRFKVRPESYGWLSAAAVEVNQVFNFCNETSLLAATRTDLKRKWLTGFDLCHLTSGSAQYFERIGADTIQRICVEYAQKRLRRSGIACVGASVAVRVAPSARASTPADPSKSSARQTQREHAVSAEPC